MLVEAVDRDTARVSIEEKLRAYEEGIGQAQKDLTESTYRAEFLETRLTTEPALEKALELANNKIEGFRFEIKAYSEQKDLLKRRLVQSTQELSRLFRQIYALTDTFFSSLDEAGNFRIEIDGSDEDVKVPEDFSIKCISWAGAGAICGVERANDVRLIAQHRLSESRGKSTPFFHPTGDGATPSGAREVMRRNGRRRVRVVMMLFNS